MTGLLIAGCAAILLAGAGPLWQWHRARNRASNQSPALQRLALRARPQSEVDSSLDSHDADRGRHITRSGWPGGSRTGPPGTVGWATPPPPPPAGASPYAPFRRASARRPLAGLSWLPVSLAVMALGIVAAVVALAAGGASSHRYTPTAESHPGASGTAAAPTTPAQSATTAPAATTTTAPAPSTTASPTTAASSMPGGPPVVSAVSPAAAAPGQTVTLSGSNLFSPSGRIVVMFGSTQAGVSCPTQTTCVATVPPANGQGPDTQVTVSTDAGTSAPVRFTYR